MTATDQTIASMGLPRHPGVGGVADELEEVAKRLREHGARAEQLSFVLACRGYAGATLGDGGSRGSDATSSTERNALSDDPMARWYDADAKFAWLLRNVWLGTRRLGQAADELVRRGADDDPIPAGTGECPGCGRFCRPDKDRPGNRLVSGLCNASCYKAWSRAGRPPRSAWVAHRRAQFIDEQGVLHTPEPDPTVDLSTELADRS